MAKKRASFLYNVSFDSCILGFFLEIKTLLESEEIDPMKLSAAHLRLLQEARERVNVSFVAIFIVIFVFFWLILMIFLTSSAKRDSIWAIL